VIVAAEMLVGGTGIGYFVWNEWNNLSITNIVTAILLAAFIGGVYWLFVVRRAADFDRMARIPLDDEAPEDRP